MPEEETTEASEELNNSDDESASFEEGEGTALNTDDGTGSPPVDEGRALEERLRRIEDRNRYLEESQRLMERFTQQPQQQVSQQQDVLPEDLALLDKTLDPLLQRRFKERDSRYGQLIAQQRDELDNIRYEKLLDKEYPELSESEDERSRTDAQVEEIRTLYARQNNQWLSRLDAFYYLEGVKRRAERREKKGKAKVDEGKRRSDVDLSKSLPKKPTLRKPDASSAVEKIKDKARVGERLTREERQKLAESIGDRAF